MRIYQQDQAATEQAEAPPQTASPAQTESTEAVMPEVRFEITRGRARHKMRKVTSPVFLIGSDAECDMVLGDPSFAAVHLYLFVREDSIFLRSIESTPEVRVNNALFRAGEIYDGSRIAMGGYEFHIHVDQPHPGSRKDSQTDSDGRYIPFHGTHEDPQGVQAVRRLLRDIRMDITASKLTVYDGPQLGSTQLPTYLGERDSA